MFFHIDESGNTGNNLFDLNQPRLSYGVLSSRTNVDALCKNIHRKILNKINDEQIHANELGIGGLCNIASELIELQKKMHFDFDYYFIDKDAYALVKFFEAVFDAGLNEAVKWEAYWTPMRFMLIHKLSILFDEALIKESWRLCTAKRIEKHKDDIVQLLSALKERTEASVLDKRSKELIIDAFDFGISNPTKIDFGSADPKMDSPNAIGFQFVVAAIARKVRKKNRKKASSIIIDRQSEFNKSQITTHYRQGLIANGIRNAPHNEKEYYLRHPLHAGLEHDEIMLKGLPDNELTVTKSSESIGLQVVDVYLWIANKLISGNQVPDELMALWNKFSNRSLIDGISLDGMAERFSRFEKMLPAIDSLSDEQRALAAASVESHRQKVRLLKYR